MKLINRSLITALIFSLILWLGAGFVFGGSVKIGGPCGSAADCVPGLQCTAGVCTSPLGQVGTPYGGEYAKEGGMGAFLTNVIKGTFIVAGMLLFMYLILGGFKYMTAGGDEKAVDAAKKIITNAVIGLVIIAVAFFIVSILSAIFFGEPKFIVPVFVGPEL